MTLQALQHLSNAFPDTDPMPVLFLGHGSPMNAVEDNEFVRNFRALGQDLPTPSAILCISAHWLTQGTFVTAMEHPATIHDFGGFPDILYQQQYPAPGSPALAKATQGLIEKTGVGMNDNWGLDHGAWTVLKHLYPEAQIPIVQMSIDYTKSATWHFELAQELMPLRKKGVLIVGSGNIIHNLRMIDFANFHKDDYGYDWAIEARAVFNKHLLDHNFAPLLHWEKLGSFAQQSIPTPDHYWPLIYTLGLKTSKDPLRIFNDKLMAGSLSMTSVQIG